MFEVFRTRLRDMLFGKPRIMVLNDTELVSEPPVFIVGSFRSGTTLLRMLLNSHRNIACPPETKFLSPLMDFLQHGESLEALESMGYDSKEVARRLRVFVDGIYADYSKVYGKDVLVDKTPEYVRYLPEIDEFFDNKAKFILIYRNGLDVANSTMNNHIVPLEEDKSLEKCFDYWLEDTQLMLEWQRAVPERCHTLIYEEMCLDLKGMIEPTLQFLGEEWDDNVLNWYSQGHDRGFEDIKARRQRKVRLSHGNFKKWDPVTVEKFKQKSHSVHKEIGYDPESLLPV